MKGLPRTAGAVALLVGICATPAAAAGPSSQRAAPQPAQIAAFEAMREEAETYARGAVDYEHAMTDLVTFHYEEKRRAILGGLEREIVAEKTQLRQARETAIRRLEEFVAGHSGAAAHPEATPDAMVRLAALYEERARADTAPDADLGAALGPAIRTYKRVLREFPRYAEAATVHYFLGHALADARRLDEAQQVWRSLVCHDRYPYPVAADPKDPDHDVVAPLPQDHDASYWRAWRGRYRRPEQLRSGARAETVFEDPYPDDCRPIVQPDTPGREPRYLAEVWWRIGEWEFDQSDVGGGVLDDEPAAVWDYARAASAYRHALRFQRPPIHGVALYKYAWTLFKQQRYEAAVREFVRLLRYTDEQERRTGDRGADFRQEAYTYIAGSLAHADFAGPGPDEPLVARPDELDTCRSAAEVEAKLRVAIDRVQDPRIVPQDDPWTIEVYRALAQELRSIGQYRSALALYQRVLDRWPLDPSAPDTQAAIADVDELLAAQTRVGEERRGYEQQVLVARTALWHYVGDTAWVDANRDDPTALRHADALARRGLEGAASTHTRNAQSAVEQADRAADSTDKERLAAQALDEYRLAASGWRALVEQRPDDPGAYRRRTFLAQALHGQVRLGASLHAWDPAAHAPPTPREIAEAVASALAVRDSDADDAYLEDAALWIVDLADVGRDLARLEPRTAPRTDGPPGNPHVVAEELPEVLRRSIEARDEYARRVPAGHGAPGRPGEYARWSADQLFLYGHFDEARARFEPLYEEHCGRDALGYEAWKRLVEMSNLAGDAARSRELALAEKARSCAVTGPQKAEEARGVLTDRVLETIDLDRARALYDQGDYRAAIALFEPFVRRHGDRHEFERLEPAAREERRKQLGMAYDAIATAHLRAFAFDQAADAFARTAEDDRMEPERRAGAARNALALYTRLGGRQRAAAMHQVLLEPAMRLGPAERIEADYTAASFDYDRWESSRDDETARRSAVAALSDFHERARGKPEGARFALEAAHRVATLLRADRDPSALAWWRATLANWQLLAAHPTSSARATDAPWRDYGAEAEFALVEEDVRRRFDLAAGRPRYHGTVAAVRKQIDDDLAAVQRMYEPRLDHVARTYGSFAFAAAATAREGALYDAIRSGLDAAVPDYFTPQQTALFDRIEQAARRMATAGRTADADALRDRVADAQQQVREAWHEVKQRYLDACSRAMVGKYVTAAFAARAAGVSAPAVDDAVGRLAHYTDYLGDATMRRYVEIIRDPRDPARSLVYEDGEFLRWRPGVDGPAPTPWP